MDLDSFIQTTKADLEYISKEKRIPFVKHKLSQIKDEATRKTAENAIFMLLEGNTINRPGTVVIMIHGIRTYGEWHYQLKQTLSHYNNILTFPIRYGYLDVLTFMFPIFTRFIRNVPIDHVTEQIRSIISDHPDKTKVIIAHSFGTYVIAHMLKIHSDLQIDRVIFCGSIVPEKFKWHRMKNFPNGGLVNDCGTKDAYPILAKGVSRGYGPSGVVGFNSSKTQDRFHNVKHSEFFNEDFMKTFWIPFIADGRIENSDWSHKKNPLPWSWSMMSLFPMAIWVYLAALIAAFIFL